MTSVPKEKFVKTDYVKQYNHVIPVMIVEMDYFVSTDFAVINNATHGRNVTG